jgi:hypothetical protein
MARAVLIKPHLYLSAFFSTAIVLVAVSVGLYLMGIKSYVGQSEVGSQDSGATLLADPSHAACSIREIDIRESSSHPETLQGTIAQSSVQPMVYPCGGH